MPDVEPNEPEGLTPDEIVARNKKIMLAALVRTGKHVYGYKPRPRRRENKEN